MSVDRFVDAIKTGDEHTRKTIFLEAMSVIEGGTSSMFAPSEELHSRYEDYSISASI